MHDLNTTLANLAVSWNLAADRLDAEAASIRQDATVARQQADAQRGSLTPAQLRSPNYRASEASIAEARAAGFESKARQAEAKAAAERRRAGAARSGIFLLTREDQRDPGWHGRFKDIFTEARQAGRLVMEGSLTDAAPTKNQESTTTPNPGKTATPTVAGIERRAAATAGEVLTPGINTR